MFAVSEDSYDCCAKCGGGRDYGGYDRGIHVIERACG
jgi:hypothetical protein